MHYLLPGLPYQVTQLVYKQYSNVGLPTNCPQINNYIQNNITYNKLYFLSKKKNLHFMSRKEISSKAKHNWLAGAVLMCSENKTIRKHKP